MIVFRHPLIARALAHRALRFLLVGGVNTVFAYCVFTGFIYFGFTPTLALTCSTIIGVAFNFLTYGRLTFGSRDLKRLPSFCLTYAILFVINLCALRGLVALGVHPAIAQAGLVLPLAALSYIVQRDLVFRIRPHGGRSA